MAQVHAPVQTIEHGRTTFNEWPTLVITPMAPKPIYWSKVMSKRYTDIYDPNNIKDN